MIFYKNTTFSYNIRAILQKLPFHTDQIGD